jgi:hypothetical protein
MISGFSFSAGAKVLVSCEGTTKIFSPNSKLHFKIVQDDKTHKLSVFQNGAPVDEDVQLVETTTKGLTAIMKCSPYDNVCLNKASQKDGPDLKELGGLVQLAMLPRAEGDKVGALGSIKPEEITSAKIYKIGKTTKMGTASVYELYGKKHKLLGRFIYAIETLPCIDKAEPSQDVGKILKDLEKNPPPVPLDGGGTSK